MESEKRDYIEDGMMVSEITGTYEALIKNADGEAEIHTLHKHSTKRRPLNSQLPFEQVQAAKIYPDRRKPIKRDFETSLFFGDAQIGYRRIDDRLIPLHDERAIKAAQLFARDLRPDKLVSLGDDTDLSEVGRYAPDSDHFLGTLQPSLQRTHDMYAEFTAATPGAERHVVDSNHAKRLGDYVLKNAFPLYGITKPGDLYPALSYPGLLALDKIGWEFHGGYGHAEYTPYEDVAAMHGTLAVSRGSTAARLSAENLDRHIIQGHKHSIESHYSTDRRGRSFGAHVVGALCRIDGIVPSFHSAINEHNQPLVHYENWQNGVGVGRRYEDGTFIFEQVPIQNGTIHYHEKVYNG